MDVYLVPVGADRHELYCEVPDLPAEDEQDSTEGFFTRLRSRFREMLTEAERERRHPHSPGRAAGWAGRLKRRSMRWVAESIAEQRLLWHLRKQDEACLYYPDDMSEPAGIGALRSLLGHDFDKHRFWMIIDSLGFVASGLLMLLPGPNLIAYYFAFRVVGHYLSLRGARRGLDCIRWRTAPSPPLAELRRVVDLDPEQRVLRVRDVAVRLRLEHLASFFERMAIPAP